MCRRWDAINQAMRTDKIKLSQLTCKSENSELDIQKIFIFDGTIVDNGTITEGGDISCIVNWNVFVFSKFQIIRISANLKTKPLSDAWFNTWSFKVFVYLFPRDRSTYIMLSSRVNICKYFYCFWSTFIWKVLIYTPCSVPYFICFWLKSTEMPQCIQ